jgi:hypothetical protein
MNIFTNYQFSCHDQSIEGREKIAISNFTICPKCDSTEFTKDHDIANCRMEIVMKRMFLFVNRVIGLQVLSYRMG